MEFRMRKDLATVLLSLVLLSGATVLLNACNTTAGAGKDVSAVGHAVTNSADKVKSGM
jgi:predicted small secreted protein